MYHPALVAPVNLAATGKTGDIRVCSRRAEIHPHGVRSRRGGADVLRIVSSKQDRVPVIPITLLMHAIPVYFLDSSLDENATWDRTLTDFLYGGDDYYRLCQQSFWELGECASCELSATFSNR